MDEKEYPLCWHIHTFEPPYCSSFTAHDPGLRDRTEKAAIEAAMERRGVLLGPFNFDYMTCQHRLESCGEEPPSPIDEWAMDPKQKYRATTGQRWHVHSDKPSYCRSFESEEDAEAIAARMMEGDPLDYIRVIGPMKHPAIACLYYQTRSNADEAAK